MSIAQKGQTAMSATTWLPRFWRKPDGVGVAEANGPASPTKVVVPLDDRPEPVIAAAAATRPQIQPSPVSPPPALDERTTIAAPIYTGNNVRIHPLACVDRAAQLGDDVEIGPFCVVGPHVRLGRGCKLMNNVTIIGHTTIGANNLFFPNAVIGAQPQDKKFAGELTRLEIGDNNHFREGVTIHVGTAKGGGLTKVGSGNMLMVNCHLGHDVVLGDNCVFANNVMLAGHVHIGNAVVLSGAAAIHHYVTVGDYAYAGGQTKITHDVPPFVKIDGADTIRGTNSVGLRRNGFSETDINAVEQAIWRLFLDRDREPVNVTLRKLRAGLLPELSNNPQVNRVLEFLERRNLGRHGRYLESLRAG